MAKLLDDKVAIVTGASQGLGLAIASALAVDGYHQVLVQAQALAHATRQSVFQTEEDDFPGDVFGCVDQFDQTQEFLAIHVWGGRLGQGGGRNGAQPGWGQGPFRGC